MSIAQDFDSSTTPQYRLDIPGQSFGDFFKYRSGTSSFVHQKNWLNWAVLVLALTGLGIASYLSWVALTSSKIGGCSGGAVFDCNHVMGTKWASVLGVPVALPAALLYLAMAVAITSSLFSSNIAVQNISRTVITFGAIAAAVAAIWFITLQVFVVKHLCVYCLAAHSCGILLALLIMCSGFATTVSKWLAFGVGTIGVATIAVIQISSEPPKTYEIETFDTPADVKSGQDVEVFSPFDVKESPADDAPIFEPPVVEALSNDTTRANTRITHFQSIAWFHSIAALGSGQLSAMIIANPVQQPSGTPQDSTSPGNGNTIQSNEPTKPHPRMVGLAGNQVRLNVDHWPICGDKNANSIGVEMFDYTCPHCRATHQAIKSAMQRSNNGFAILSLAVPMNQKCNPTVQATNPKHLTACDLAYLSIAVWRVAPEKYSEYHDWLFTGTDAPTVASARMKAATLVGAQQLDKELQSGVPQQYVAKQCQLYQSLGGGVIPKMYSGSKIVTGQVTDAETFLNLFTN